MSGEGWRIIPVIGTETVLLSLDRQHLDERLALRRAYFSGAIVRTDLVKRSRPVRILDYTETFCDGRFEIAVSIAAEPIDADGRRLSR